MQKFTTGKKVKLSRIVASLNPESQNRGDMRGIVYGVGLEAGYPFSIIGESLTRSVESGNPVGYRNITTSYVIEIEDVSDTVSKFKTESGSLYHLELLADDADVGHIDNPDFLVIVD